MNDEFLSQQVLSQIIKGLPNYVFCKDRNLVYRLCNQNFLKYSGFDEYSDVIGKTDNEMPWGTTTSSIYQLEDREVLAGNSILFKEVPMEILGQERKTLLVSKTPLYNVDKIIIGILGIYIDITDQKHAEEREKKALLEATEAKTKAQLEENLRLAVTVVAGRIAHDMTYVHL